MEESHIFRFHMFSQLSQTTLRATGVYFSGAFYAAAFYSLLDSALLSAHRNGSDLHVTFPDWIPFLVSSLGMLIINTVDKSLLSGQSFSSFSGGSSADWQAKVVLFLGFAALSGGLAGSIVILVLKYIVPDIPMPTLLMGILNVVANGSIMISCIILWLAQNLEDEYSYSLQL